jgi:hypothetical protein
VDHALAGLHHAAARAALPNARRVGPGGAAPSRSVPHRPRRGAELAGAQAERHRPRASRGRGWPGQSRAGSENRRAHRHRARRGAVGGGARKRTRGAARWTGKPLVAGEAIPREQAIRFYTINNAFLTFEEKEKGSIEAGKLADLVVIDRDIPRCPEDDVKDTVVERTYLGGKLIHERR